MLAENCLRKRGNTKQDRAVKPHAKTITFHICVLNPDMTASIHHQLDYVPGEPEEDFFTIASTATRASLEIADGQGWSVASPGGGGGVTSAGFRTPVATLPAIVP
jgi:hypothetical protein